jgi:hypothetical protein
LDWLKIKDFYFQNNFSESVRVKCLPIGYESIGTLNILNVFFNLEKQFLSHLRGSALIVKAFSKVNSNFQCNRIQNFTFPFENK